MIMTKDDGERIYVYDVKGIISSTRYNVLESRGNECYEVEGLGHYKDKESMVTNIVFRSGVNYEKDMLL